MAAPKLDKKDMTRLIKVLRSQDKMSNTDMILCGKLMQMRKALGVKKD